MLLVADMKNRNLRTLVMLTMQCMISMAKCSVEKGNCCHQLWHC